MRAILEDALRVVFGGERSATTSRRRIRRETVDWFGSNDRQWPFSFLNVCDALGVDAERIRDDVRHVPSLAA